MKRVCKRPIQLDAVTLCYEVVHPYYYEQLSILDYGECLDMGEFRLYRTEGRYFENVYVIRLDNGTRDIEWGVLKFNLARGDAQSNTLTNGNRKICSTGTGGHADLCYKQGRCPYALFHHKCRRIRKHRELERKHGKRGKSYGVFHHAAIPYGLHLAEGGIKTQGGTK